MIAEIILLLAIVGIFIVIARRLPDAMREHQHEAETKAPAQTAGKAARRWPWQKDRENVAAPKGLIAVAAPAVTAPTNETQRQVLLSDEAFLQEGDEYLKTGKLKEAERAYLRGVAKNPKNPRLYNRLGAIYLKQRNYRDALEAFEAARDFDGTKASRHYNVALAAWQLGNLAKARAAIGEAIRIDSASVKYQDLQVQIQERA